MIVNWLLFSGVSCCDNREPVFSFAYDRKEKELFLIHKYMACSACTLLFEQNVQHATNIWSKPTLILVICHVSYPFTLLKNYRTSMHSFKPLAPHRCGFESRQGLWILSCEEAIQQAYGTSGARSCLKKNAWKGTWGLPPPVKLERRDITYTVSMWPET
jgi:hypothetical protein